ncbi:hypothetical protein EDD21DRAFT_354101 [Dissophora ornata]|nr:hypothetical protein EDD21DRAFT_354101 [Dissophora ornata]
MSNQLSGQQQHRRHQQHQLRQQHEIDDLDLDIDIDIDNDNDNAVSIDDDAASTGSIGPPPVTYMANMIANHLMPQGASMFGRREDASCILRVGQTRFYVHVQMLASRSPTFRRIFDDMIRNEAWGASSDTASSSESMAVYEDGQYDSDDESMQERQSFESNPAEQGDMRSHASHESQTTVQQSSDDLLSSMVTENLQLRSSEHDSNNLSIDVRRSLQSRDEHGSGQDSGDDLDDIDDSLPELTVALEDPDGDHFKELLYWVFNICLSYETTTSPDQGLRGMAMATLRVLPDDDYSTQITNL